MGVVRVLIFAMAAASLISMACATNGVATLYKPVPGVPPACNGLENNGTMLAALSPPMFDNGAACGKKLKVQCTGGTNAVIGQPCHPGSAEVTAVDRCVSCGSDEMALSEEAFSVIADVDVGEVEIEFEGA